MTAARWADLQQGGDRSKPQKCALTHAGAATQLGVAERMVDKASTFLNGHKAGRITPKLVEAVDSGKMRLAQAEKIARLPIEQQMESVAQYLSAAKSGVRKPRQWACQFDEVARQAERLSDRMVALASDAEKAGELTPARRARLEDACRRVAQRFTHEIGHLERVPRRGDPIPVESI